VELPELPRVFIVGCARSGTTWVNTLLGQHDEIVTGPESHIFPVLYRPLRAVGPTDEWRAAVLDAYDARAHQAADQPLLPGPHRWVERNALEDLIAAAMAAQLRGDAAARRVLQGILASFFAETRSAASHTVAEKTPHHLRFADQILTWWPQAKVVEVVRDGRDVCVSLDHKSRVAAWAPTDRVAQIDSWLAAVRRGQVLRSRHDFAPRWHRVRYEDLASDATSAVTALFRFLDVAADEGTVQQSIEQSSIDKQRDVLGHVRLGVVGEWRSEFSNTDRRLFDRMAHNELVSLGYVP
jgi:hypothetical protein